MQRTTRMLVFVALGVVSFLPSIVLLDDLLQVAHRSDADLIAQFRGAAVEDIFGFGFWPAWFIFALLELLVISLAWLTVRPDRLRYAVLALALTFTLVSVASYQSFSRVRNLWASHSAQ